MTIGPEDTIDPLLRKARQACRSARALLELQDVDGACNRAYYAMFDAARAALVRSEDPAFVDVPRTHRGVFGLFNEQFVKTGIIALETGRLLRRGETLRVIADYRSASVNLMDAAAAVDNAEVFLAEIERYLAIFSGTE